MRAAAPFAIPFALALLLGAAGCRGGKPPANTLDAIDNDLVNGSVADESPADTPANRALAQMIRVDPAKTGQRAESTRAAPTQIAEAPPHHAAMPAVTEDGEGSVVDEGSGCLGGLAYSNGWAAKLPADLPMHPAAQLQEAAGHDGACQARIVSFAVRGDRGQVLGWYKAKAQAAGYSTGRADKASDWILVGDKGPSAYSIIFGPAQNGETPVDYVWTSGN